MKNLKTVIAAVAVFAMTIGSGFAMDNNPPTEPVKKVLETEVMQTTVNYGYIDENNDCVFYMVEPENPTCSTIVTSIPCTEIIGGFLRHLRLATYDDVTNEWSCGDLLYKIL